MATYTASAAAATYPVYLPDCGQVAVARGTYEIAAALAKDDVVRMCKVPASCDIIGGWLRADDLDTDANEEVDLDVGIASDPDALGNFGVLNGDAVTNQVPEGGIMLPLAGKLISDGYLATGTSDQTVQVTFTAAAKAGGTGTLSVLVLYTRSLTVGS